MSNKHILKILSISLASISFVFSLLICSHFTGFVQGFSAANDPTGEGAKIAKIMVPLGLSVYETFVTSYIVVAICFCIYSVTKLREKSTLSRVISFIPLIIIIYVYWRILYYKNLYLEENSIFGYSTWMISSAPFDWFCFFIGVVLLIIQLIILLTFHFEKKGRKID